MTRRTLLLALLGFRIGLCCRPAAIVTPRVGHCHPTQEVDGCYFATWESARESGCGWYSTTVVGALAELCATLLKVDEDNTRA